MATFNKRHNIPINIAILLALIINFKNVQAQEDPDYVKRIKSWDSTRIASLKARNGWLNLAGLYWLKPGNNLVGSAPSNTIIFPKGPGYFGNLLLSGEEVTFTPAPGSGIKANGMAIAKEVKLNGDFNKRPVQFEIGSLCWFVIKRGSKTGIRLRDYDSEKVKIFAGIDRFPIDTKWRIPAKFTKNNTGVTVDIPDVLGNISHDTIPGTLDFKWEGKIYSLYPTGSSESMFVVFGDQTNKTETYGGGRFLNIEKPDISGKTWIDFNKAYNPPCCYTEFATCPLPPKENKLPFRVLAGEKSNHH